jgi:hypothetical protein
MRHAKLRFFVDFIRREWFVDGVAGGRAGPSMSGIRSMAFEGNPLEGNPLRGNGHDVPASPVLDRKWTVSEPLRSLKTP